MATAASLPVIWNNMARAISKVSSKPFVIDQQSTLSGGSINHAYRISGGNQHYFVKLNRADNLAMFEAEMAGLHELTAAQAIRVPRPVCTGVTGNQSWLVTEYIEFASERGESAQCLGRKLADLHRCQSEQFCRIQFGWHRDNTIGLTAQHNTWTDDWLEFYREQRLSVQFDLAAKNGFTGSLQHKGERLMANLGVFFSTYQPEASLLHGDLWGGNCAFDVGGDPVIFDPAVYYGDREADMAMTELFGGFSAHFYAAYAEAWPLDAGYAVRKTLYNLYHILNHVNLFGATYAAQAEAMTDRLLAEIG